MLALALISHRDRDITGQAKKLARAMGTFLMRSRGLDAEGLPCGEDALDPDLKDLIHEHRPVDRADEYRRRAVERVLAACPYQL